MSNKKNSERPPHGPAPSQPEQPPAPKFTFVEPRNGIYNIYANHVGLNWTAYDVRIKFGTLIRVTAEGEYIVEEPVAVNMSWPEAKVLLNILKDTIDRFEKLNGEISSPKIP